MAIAVDVDDVLCDTVNSIIPLCNRVFGVYKTRDDFKTYQISDVYGGAREAGIKMFRDFLQTPEGQAMPPVKGAVEGIRSLNNLDDLIIITCRDGRFRRETEEWLDKHFSGMFSAVYMNEKAKNKGNEYYKSVVAVDKGVTLLIEDQIKHAEDCAKAGIPVLLCDNPWNQTEYDVLPHLLITRVYTWPEMTVRIMYDNLT